MKELIENAQQVIKLARVVQGMRNGLPQTLLDSAFQLLGLNEQQMIQNEIRKQNVSSIWELHPTESICDSYRKIRSSLEIIPRMNDCGSMQGTYVLNIPSHLPEFERKLLKKYHEANQKCLQQIVMIHQGREPKLIQQFDDSRSSAHTLNLTDEEIVKSISSRGKQSSEKTAKPVKTEPKPQQFTNN